MRTHVARLVALGLVAIIALVAQSAAADPHPAANFTPYMQDRIVPAGAKPELIWNEGTFTEGPAVDGRGRIVFSDIGNRIMQYDPATRAVTVFREPSGKANGLMFDTQGRLAACEGGGPGGNRRVSITDSDGQVRALAERFEGKRFNSPNDLAIAPDGRVYFTDPRYGDDEGRELDFEGVFVVDPAGKVRLATREVEKPNGILVGDHGHTVYVADNNSRADGAHNLLAFRVAPDGTLGDKRVLFDFGPNVRGIDGMTLDQQGNIYATAGSGETAGVYVFSSRGAPLAFIPTPGDPTNCEFGFGDQEKILFITAAGPQPAAGAPRHFALYQIALAIPGYHVWPKAMP
jgi:gluconolactonase